MAAVIYNRLNDGHPARHRRDDPLRARQVQRAADRRRAGSRVRYNTRINAGPAADSDRQPRARRRSRPPRSPPMSTTCYLRGQAVHLRRARLQRQLRRVPAELPLPTSEALEAEGGAPTRADAPRRDVEAPRRPRAARSPTRAPRRCTTPRSPALGLGEEWRYEAIEVGPEAFAELVSLDAGRGLRRRQRDRPPQGRGARGRRRALGGGARDRRRQHAQLRRRRDPRLQHRRRGIAGALPAPPGGERALVLGAGGAARAVVWALVRAGAEVEVWNRTELRSRNLCAELGGTAGRTNRAAPPTS